MSLPTPYYQDDAALICRHAGSGRFLKGVPQPKSDAHRAKISAALKLAWQTKRKRLHVGAKNKDVHGYIRVKVSEGHAAWKKEHILVIESHIGRPLKHGEVVHHINGQRDDNRLCNLYLCQNNSQHMKMEQQLKTLFRDLLEKGVVCFNVLTGEYEIV